MPNGTDTRRVAVWLVGAMFSACACLFLACSCLGVRAWAVPGRAAAAPAGDPRPAALWTAAQSPHILLRKARQQSTCTVRACRYCSTVIPVSW